jgi:hypothetical protein
MSPLQNRGTVNPSANVLNSVALVEFRAALCTFADRAKDALGMMQLDLRRAKDWLEEQKKHWQAAVRQTEDEVFEAKNELTRRRMIRIGDRSPDCTEQEKALALARRRLEIAEERLNHCRRWERALPEALLDYDAPANQLMAMLDGDIPRMLAYLERKVASLEEYAQ